MRILGYLSLMAVLAIMVMVMAGGPAVASPAKGYQITYLADRGHYCLKPLTADEADRLGITMYKTECHTAVAWAGMGLKITRN
ncbi:hypothetical protein FPZ24_14070 [Sphingomonas panacisoli]|uniref:Uncharacterized protein n=1 Tax=Sphingomonas panacisoli TaxID=1813879 RepID=A0A5B8LKB5_9SPHN|nr:hypothetical protein [Sphingomonas panacisoli]QDZ08456.1 hypothetical protein FPZ24_14070 [Sphingomonas panacisoli]